MTTSAPLRRFSFDTVFDEAGGVASAPAPVKRAYTPEEVEAIRAQCFADGERSAIAAAEARQADALEAVRRQIAEAMGSLAAVAHGHREGAGALALAAARVIAGAALDAFPEAPARAALEALAREVEAAPTLHVRASADCAERVQASLEAAAAGCGFPGRVAVRADLAGPPGAFVFDWGDGRAQFDPGEAARRVSDALQNALLAEGLHAEPRLPTRPDAGGETP